MIPPVAQIKDERDIVLVNRHRALERMWALTELSEDFDAVADLKKTRVKGDAARNQRLKSFEIVDEKDLEERTIALLARMRQ